jgi:hypothetical protein
LSETEEALQNFVNALAKDFKVNPPKVEILGSEAFPRYCPTDATACYDYKRETIVLREGKPSLRTVLHEFWHHYQYVKSGRDSEKAFPSTEYEKIHCQREFEREAKTFEYLFSWFYEEVWERLVGKKRG